MRFVCNECENEFDNDGDFELSTIEYFGGEYGPDYVGVCLECLEKTRQTEAAPNRKEPYERIN